MIRKEVLETVKELISNNEKPSLIETGFYELDSILECIKKSSLIVIGARPAMGKTAFAMNIMQNLLQENKKCLFFSPDMSQEAIVKRFIIQHCEIDSFLISCTKHLEQNHKEKIAETLTSISEYNLTIDDTCSITTEKIREKIKTERPEFVFIDYLQLIYASDKIAQSNDIKEIMADLKQIANDNNCMIFIISQLSNAVEERDDHRPILSDLKGPDIEDIADVVIFLYRDSYYNPIKDIKKNGFSKKDETEIIIAKNKLGPVGIFQLFFKGQILKYFNPLKKDVF